MELSILSFKELCFLYLKECLDKKYSNILDNYASCYYDEIKNRLKISYDTFEDYVDAAKHEGLITESDYQEICVALRINNISGKAIDKLKK